MEDIVLKRYENFIKFWQWELDGALDSLAHARKGVDKTWIKECKYKVECIRNNIRKLLLEIERYKKNE